MRSPVSAYSLASCRLIMSGQRHRAAVRRHQAHQHVRVGQVGALGHEHDVGQGDQAAAQPHCRSVHGGHDGHPACDHAGDDLPAVGQRLLAQPRVAGQLVQVGEVAAGRERLAVPGQHDGPGLVVGIDLREQSGQTLVQLVVGGVELIGPVQPDDPDRTVADTSSSSGTSKSVIGTALPHGSCCRPACLIDVGTIALIFRSCRPGQRRPRRRSAVGTTLTRPAVRGCGGPRGSAGSAMSRP